MKLKIKTSNVQMIKNVKSNYLEDSKIKRKECRHNLTSHPCFRKSSLPLALCFPLVLFQVWIFCMSTSSPDVSCSSLPFSPFLLRVCSHFIHLDVSHKAGGWGAQDSIWAYRTSLGPCFRHQSYSRSETKEACVKISTFFFHYPTNCLTVVVS